MCKSLQSIAKLFEKEPRKNEQAFLAETSFRRCFVDLIKTFSVGAVAPARHRRCGTGAAADVGNGPNKQIRNASRKPSEISGIGLKTAETENSYDLRTASRRNLRAFKMVFTARLMSSSVSVRSSERSSKLNAMLFLPSGMPLSPASLG